MTATVRITRNHDGSFVVVAYRGDGATHQQVAPHGFSARCVSPRSVRATLTRFRRHLPCLGYQTVAVEGEHLLATPAVAE